MLYWSVAFSFLCVLLFFISSKIDSKSGWVFILEKIIAPGFGFAGVLSLLFYLLE